MENKETNKLTLTKYLEVLKESLPFLGFFFLITFAAWLFDFVLSYYGAGLGILNFVIFGLLLIPFYFASQIAIRIIEKEKGSVNANQFFRYVKGYYRPPFFGCYHIIRSYLFSVLWSFLGMILFTFVYILVANNVDPAFVSAVETMASYIESQDTEALMNFLNTSEPIINFYAVVDFIDSAIFVLSMLFYVSRSSAMLYFGEGLTIPSPKFIRESYRNAFKEGYAKGYNKDYYKGTWFLYLIIISMYAIGCIVGSFLFENHELKWTLMSSLGVGFAIIPIPFLLPYFFLFLSWIMTKYKEAFSKSAIEIIKFSYRELKKRNLFSSEEEESHYKDAIDAYEKKVKDKKEENEKKDEINKDDYGSSDHH